MPCASFDGSPQKSAPLGPPRPAPSPRRRWRAGHPRRTAEHHRHDPTRSSRIRSSACDGSRARCRRFRRPFSPSSGTGPARVATSHRCPRDQDAPGTLAPCSPCGTTDPSSSLETAGRLAHGPLPWVCSTSVLALASAPLTAFRLRFRHPENATPLGGDGCACLNARVKKRSDSLAFPPLVVPDVPTGIFIWRSLGHPFQAQAQPRRRRTWPSHAIHRPRLLRIDVVCSSSRLRGARAWRL